MKLSTLISPLFQEALAKLSKAELPLATAFKLKGVARKVAEQLDKYEEVRKEALTRFGEKDANGDVVLLENGNVKFTDEGLQAFMAELNTLINSDVDVGKIKINELGGKVSLSANDVAYLEDIFEE